MIPIVFLGNRGNYKASLASYLSSKSLFEKGSISETAGEYCFGIQNKIFTILDVYPTSETIPYMSYSSNIFFVFRGHSSRGHICVEEFIEDVNEKTDDNAIVIEIDAPKNLEEVPHIAMTILRILLAMD